MRSLVAFFTFAADLPVWEATGTVSRCPLTPHDGSPSDWIVLVERPCHWASQSGMVIVNVQ